MREAAQYPPGKQLPGTVYRVVRHLATGGMGSVYDVEDVTVGKRYVLKTLHPQLVAREDLARRMEQEARVLARLLHPNIVDVVTAGVTSDAQRLPFYVMERLNGQNLRVLLQKLGALDLTHCFRIAIDVLDALEHAHESGVIHRDVKPENIFLHRHISGATITKLLDFGIMRLVDRKQSHTQGRFIGTLRYASPEQITGGPMGASSDLYSLGAVLYEMIAGRGPFDDAGDAYAIGAAHVNLAPPPLSRFRSVPPEVERVVMASLAKTPEERPRDAFTFAADLRRLLRVEETAPKSSTAVAILSSVPSTREGGDDGESGDAGEAGTGGERASDSSASSVPTATIPMPDDLAIAPTVASEPGTAPLGPVRTPRMEGAPLDAIVDRRASVPVARAASAPSVVVSESALGGHAGAGAALVDRAALTRESDAGALLRRLSQNGTAVDDSLIAPHDGEGTPQAGVEVLEALRREPVVGVDVGTGPTAGEASTRPPDRGWLVGIVAACLGAVLLVGGAVLFVTKPWASGSGPRAAEVAGAGTALVSGASHGAAGLVSSPAPVGEGVPVLGASAIPAAAEATTARGDHALPSPAAATPAAVASVRGTVAPRSPAAARPAASPPPRPPSPRASASIAPAAATAKKAPGPPAAPRPEEVGFD